MLFGSQWEHILLPCQCIWLPPPYGTFRTTAMPIDNLAKIRRCQELRHMALTSVVAVVDFLSEEDRCERALFLLGLTHEDENAEHFDNCGFRVPFATFLPPKRLQSIDVGNHAALRVPFRSNVQRG